MDEEYSVKKEDLLQRQKKELKDLTAKVTALKKSIPKGDKKKKKEVQAEIALLEAETTERHEKELNELEAQISESVSKLALDDAKKGRD
jgi:OTU domain-containing protein 6